VPNVDLRPAAPGLQENREGGRFAARRRRPDGFSRGVRSQYYVGMSADELPNATLEELLEFFWTEPAVDDTVLTYSITDTRGVGLQFSFDEAEGSIQTAILFDGEVLNIVCHEQLLRFRVYGDTLLAECRGVDFKTTLELKVRPQICVRWSSLMTG
jgi:hypothetical protein